MNVRQVTKGTIVEALKSNPFEGIERGEHYIIVKTLTCNYGHDNKKCSNCPGAMKLRGLQERYCIGGPGWKQRWYKILPFPPSDDVNIMEIL